MKAALRYAKAILSLAKEKGVEKNVNDDMQLIADTIANNNELQVMLNSPVIKITDKKKVLDALFAKKVNKLTTQLFNILAKNKRLDLLPKIAKQYTVLFDELNKKQVAKVTTAIPLTSELQKKVIDKIVDLTGNSASIENNIDPSIIGGFILRIGDLQYDASISNQFNELRKEFDNSHYISQI